MKSLFIIVTAQISLAVNVMAGRPIILDKSESCSKADLVVVATIMAAKDIPADASPDPFAEEGSEWHDFGFTRVAQAEVERTLLGIAPDELWIYGGKLAAGTDFRIEEGRYLALLTRVKQNAYRAVDWHYSFAPIKDGKVGWLIERHPAKREWISPAEALLRIKAERLKWEEADTERPTTQRESDSEYGDKPQPESEGCSGSRLPDPKVLPK